MSKITFTVLSAFVGLMTGVFSYAGLYEVDQLHLDSSLAGEMNSGRTLVQIIQESGVPHNRILIAFDMDGTLASLALPVLKKTPDEKLRGGSATREIFSFLRAHGIPWFITSANPAHGLIATKLYLMELQHLIPPAFLEDGCFLGSLGGSLNFKPKLVQESLLFDSKLYSIVQCHNAIFAVDAGGGGYSFDKHTAIYYIGKTYFPPEAPPQLIIFIDDNAANVQRVYLNGEKIFSALSPSGEASSAEPKVSPEVTPASRLISILWEPHRPEPDHSYSLDWLSGVLTKGK